LLDRVRFLVSLYADVHLVSTSNESRTSYLMYSDDFLAAPEIVRRLTSQDAFENETVTFSCTVQTVDEDEPYTIQWLFNDKQIDTNIDKYTVDGNVKTGICLLTIRTITIDDEGPYRCVATNKFGSSLTTAFLAVLRKCRRSSLV
jgi:hypothetical protein